MLISKRVLFKSMFISKHVLSQCLSRNMFKSMFISKDGLSQCLSQKVH